jgi:hypothetical protein
VREGWLATAGRSQSPSIDSHVNHATDHFSPITDHVFTAACPDLAEAVSRKL